MVGFRLSDSFCGIFVTGRPAADGLVVDEVLLLLVLVVVIDEVRGGRDAVAVPGMLLVLLLLLVVCTAETVVTLDASEDASLPDEPAAPNSSSKDGREGTWALEGCSGEPENRSVFIAKWRELQVWNRADRESQRGERVRR